LANGISHFKNLCRLRVVEVFLFTVGALIFNLLVGQVPLFGKLELLTQDWRFQWRPYNESKINSDIFLIGIGDKALKEIGRWPWPRETHGNLLQGLLPYSPNAIAFDILFSEPDLRNSESDARFIQKIGIGNKVILAASIEDNNLLVPFGVLSQKCDLGLVSMPRDQDGVVRRIPLIISFENKMYPSMALEMACHHFRVSFKDLEIFPGDKIRIPRPGAVPVIIPMDEANNMMINYRGKLTNFSGAGYQQVISAIDESAGVPNEDLAAIVTDKMILIGFTGTGMDILPVPLDPNSPGVVVHANAYSNIVLNDFLVPLGPSASVLLFTLLFAGVFSTSTYLPTKWSVISAIFITGLYCVVVIIFFDYFNRVVQTAGPLVISIGMVIGITSHRMVSEAREKGRLKSTFNHFLSRNILEAVLKDPELLKMGGVRRELTVLFADVRGFTTLCESSPPEIVVPILNELLDRLTPVIFKYDGTLDKYMGDAIMAFWGAPQEQEDHALRAVKTALDMQQEIVRLHELWKDRGIPMLTMGIGINTGPMVVGNMGSSEVVTYTVIGDAVNLSSRIETLTRQYDAQILIGEETYQQVKDHVETESLGEVAVKGKSKFIRIHKVIKLK